MAAVLTLSKPPEPHLAYFLLKVGAKTHLLLQLGQGPKTTSAGLFDVDQAPLSDVCWFHLGSKPQKPQMLHGLYKITK